MLDPKCFQILPRGGATWRKGQEARSKEGKRREREAEPCMFHVIYYFNLILVELLGYCVKPWFRISQRISFGVSWSNV